MFFLVKILLVIVCPVSYEVPETTKGFFGPRNWKDWWKNPKPLTDLERVNQAIAVALSVSTGKLGTLEAERFRSLGPAEVCVGFGGFLSGRIFWEAKVFLFEDVPRRTPR